MTEHDFRYNLLNPQHTLTEYSALAPGHHQDTGNDRSIQAGDSLPVSLKGSRDLSIRLAVEKVCHLINPPGRWLAMARGPALRVLDIHAWQPACDGCSVQLDLEFAVDGALSELARAPYAEAHLAELGWHNRAGRHLGPQCIAKEA